MRKLAFLFCFSFQFLAAQTDNKKSALDSFSEFTKKVFQEKLFVHTDRTFYLTGDYLWFKIYAVDASHHRPSGLSKIAYIELLDQDNNPVLQAKILLQDGMGHGSLFIPASISSGQFIFRAYTRWMQNFSPEFYFHKEVTVVNPFKPRNAEEKKISKSGYDLQFFPEGGCLVGGIKNKVAFRMVDEAGNGIEFTGTVMNGQGETVELIKPLKFGLGHFEFTPHATQTYKVAVRDLGGKIILTKDLPVAQKEGYCMTLTNEGNEKLGVKITAAHAIHSKLMIVAQTRGEVKFYDVRSTENGAVSFIVDRDKLGEGISQITVFDEFNQPLCERLYFKRQVKNWKIIPTLKDRTFDRRRRVDVDIQINGEGGEPVEANMSISVFKIDALQETEDINIANSFLLTSDLSGRVESPEYYFSEDSLVDQALDNLMLTYGWRRFLWNDILQSKTPKLELAPEFRGTLVTGKVINPASQEPVAGVLTLLSIPGKYFKLVGARSNWQGKVSFEFPEFYGPNKIIVEPVLNKDSLFKIQLSNPFSNQFAPWVVPELILAPATAELLLEKSTGMQMENIYFEKYRSKVVIPAIDTLPFYHQADEKYFLDNYTRFPTMEDVLREYVPGVFVSQKDHHFNFSVVDKGGRYSFKDNPLVLIDGVPMMNMDAVIRYDPLRVRKLEVVTHRYFHGPVTFSGIVSLSTYKGDYADLTINPKAIVENYQGVQWEREYFSPVYQTVEERSSRMPDFRNLLVWIPTAVTGKDGNYKMSFYTSDQPGKYMGIINGLSADGKCGTASFTFEVSAKP